MAKERFDWDKEDQEWDPTPQEVADAQPPMVPLPEPEPEK